MPEELGKIERPEAEQFRPERKLYFVPLVFAPNEAQEDLAKIVQSYWEQVENHLSNLESKLGSVNRIYHELVPLGGEEGAKALEELNEGSHKITSSRMERGAELVAVEDTELLAEFMDWSRCLAIGFQSPGVFTKVYEAYIEVQKKRNEHIAERLNETLKEGEAGILFMREGHQVQFAQGIQVFYVSPPALDEMKRWIREHETERK